MATPTEAAISRWGSRVEFSLITTKVTWPGLNSFTPSEREINLQRGGKMLDTRTRLQEAMPAERRANSKLVSFSRCFPTPLVRNIRFGTNIALRPSFFKFPLPEALSLRLKRRTRDSVILGISGRVGKLTKSEKKFH